MNNTTANLDPGRLARIFLSEKCILTLIVLNALVIFIQGFDLPTIYELILSTLDHLITLMFVIEMLVKIRAWSFKGYIGSWWNRFDAVLVLLAVPSLLMWLMNSDPGLESLLVLRVLRIFKFFRFLRFVPDIQSLGLGVQRALRTSLVVLIGFFVFIFIVAVISCFLYKSTSPDFFGNPLLSLYSTFKVFTIEGWFEIPEQLAMPLSPLAGGLTKFFFIIVLLTGGIFGLSLVNSIFVDAMVSDNNDALEEKVASLERKIDHLTDILTRMADEKKA